MKPMFVILVAGTLTACQSWQARAPENPPPQRGAGMGAGASGSAGSGTAAGSGEQMGMQGHQDMCRLHQQMMSARTPEERQAIMEQAMPGMASEAREQHLQIMRQMCRPMSQ
jgi:hypothetical protein